MKFILPVFCLFMLSTSLAAQTTTSKKGKKVVIIQKSTDKDGNEVIEKKILEGDAISKDAEWKENDGNTIRITVDSTGTKKEIIINKDVRISDGEDDDDDFHFGNSSRGYTERTVTVRKNADGSVEVKEQSGKDSPYNLTVDSTEAKKPNIGVVLNDDLKVSQLVKGGAAETGGMQSGDVLTHLDGIFINDYDHLKELVSKKKIGDTVSLTYLRDRKEMKANITLKGGSTRIYFNR